MKIAKILVPTDYSACSAEAIRWAVALAEPLGARLFLMHVMNEELAGALLSTPGVSKEMLFAKEEDSLRELFATALVDENQLSLLEQALVEIGDPAEKIVTTAFLIGASMVVIPTYGQRQPSPDTVGSVTERVVRTAPCPVLTIQAACCGE